MWHISFTILYLLRYYNIQCDVNDYSLRIKKKQQISLLSHFNSFFLKMFYMFLCYRAGDFNLKLQVLAIHDLKNKNVQNVYSVHGRKHLNDTIYSRHFIINCVRFSFVLEFNVYQLPKSIWRLSSFNSVGWPKAYTCLELLIFHRLAGQLPRVLNFVQSRIRTHSRESLVITSQRP